MFQIWIEPHNVNIMLLTCTCMYIFNPLLLLKLISKVPLLTNACIYTVCMNAYIYMYCVCSFLQFLHVVNWQRLFVTRHWQGMCLIFFTDLEFLPSLVAIKHIPDKNAARILNEDVTLHAMIDKHCCCSEDYNSCSANLYPKSLNSTNSHDECNNDSSSPWNAWFDIPIKNIASGEEDAIYIKLTPNSNEVAPPYVSNNITIQLQGMLIHTLCWY